MRQVWPGCNPGQPRDDGWMDGMARDGDPNQTGAAGLAKRQDERKRRGKSRRSADRRRSGVIVS